MSPQVHATHPACNIPNKPLLWHIWQRSRSSKLHWWVLQCKRPMSIKGVTMVYMKMSLFSIFSPDYRTISLPVCTEKLRITKPLVKIHQSTADCRPSETADFAPCCCCSMFLDHCLTVTNSSNTQTSSCLCGSWSDASPSSDLPSWTSTSAALRQDTPQACSPEPPN